MKNAILPSGIEHGVEMYVFRNQLHIQYRGNRVDFNDLPAIIRKKFHQQFKADTSSIQSLREHFGLTTKKAQFVQYLKCNFGGYDRQSEITGKHINPENWDCGLRGKCKAEGIVCKLIEGQSGKLSITETKVLRLVARGLQDIEIAHELGISINTVKTHLPNIRHKLGLNNRLEMMGFAIKKALI